MNAFVNVINKVAKVARQSMVIGENDYYNEENILICGECGHARQKKIILSGGSQEIIPSECPCWKKKNELKEKELELKKAQRKKKIAIDNLKKNSLIDEKFQKCTFDNYTVTEENKLPYRIGKRYADIFPELFKKNQGLLFYGTVGNGKTHLASCIANQLMDNMFSVYAISLVKIVNNSLWFSKQEVFLNKIQSCDLLIVDDLGAERTTDYGLEIVYNIIDTRYRCSKPMIVTTNLSLNELQTTNDIRQRRIYDRVLENCYPVLFNCRSWRIKEAASRFEDMKNNLGE